MSTRETTPRLALAVLTATVLLMASLSELDHTHDATAFTEDCTSACHQAVDSVSEAPPIAEAGRAHSSAEPAEPRQRATDGYDTAASIRGPPTRSA